MIVLLNDVESKLESQGLWPGDFDDHITKDGEQQVLTIARNIHAQIPKIHSICASFSRRTLKLIHQIRVKSQDGYLTNVKVNTFASLNERSFGVLNGSPIDLKSDLFRHSRICAENGESISQVKQRGIELVSALCEGKKDENILMISHPLFCQIMCNHFLNKNAAILSKFWSKKGSLILVNNKSGWQVENGYNCIEDKSYSVDDIYSETY